MKKIIRLFVAIFCLFFVLQAIPGSFLPVLHTYLQRAVQLGSHVTLLLAEQIDALTGGGNESSPMEIADREEASGGGKTGPGAEEETGGSRSPAQPPRAGNRDASSTEEAAAAGKATADESAYAGTQQDAEADAEPSAGTAPSPSGSGESSPPGEADPFYYYYTRISREERLLYDAMLALAQAPEDGAGAEEARLISLNPSDDAFAESYTRAYNALISDHAELFWIAQGRARYECRYYVLPSFGGKYKVVLSLEIPGEDTSRDMFAGEQRRLAEAADALLEEVDLSQSEAAIALRIHDLLIDSAWYNVDAGADDYAHTAYGALVQDSMGNPGGALCDGYALAYEYLLQRAGLTCTMVCGYAGSSREDSEKHAWNLVRLEDDWYEVDPTWDDLDFLLSPSEEGYDLLLEALSDEEYMQRIRHYMFNLTTEEISDFDPGEKYRYVSYRGWVSLLQPSVHVRFSASESEETRDYVTPLAPTAEGTRYTWEMLTGNS